MIEQNEHIDKLFKQKIEQLENIPSSINWNNVKGWKEYETRYFPLTLYLRKRLMFAAAILFLVTAGAIIYLMYSKQAQELCSFDGSNKLVKEIYLKGGHHCFLAPESKIQYCRRNNLNQADTLFLEGEGYFETSQIKPLVIIAKNTVTRCINSKLNIKSFNSSKLTIISSVTGEVSTRCTDNNFPEMKIVPSERCVVYEGGIYAAKETNDDPNFLAWKTGTLTFNNIPLAYAIKTIEDYYGVTIEVKSKDVKYCRITSEFENTGIDEVLKYLQNSYKTKIRKTNNAIILEDGMCHLNN